LGYDIVIGTGREGERQYDWIWMPSRGVATWVADQMRKHVTDTSLKTDLEPYVKAKIRYLPVAAFPEAKATQMIAVIVGPLLSAARQEWPPDNDPLEVYEFIEEFVTDTRQWVADINDRRQAAGERLLELPVY
jgi:hypothetical protein